MRPSYAATLKRFHCGSNLDSSKASFIFSLFFTIVDSVVLGMPKLRAILVFVVVFSRSFFSTAARISIFLERVRADCLAAIVLKESTCTYVLGIALSTEEVWLGTERLYVLADVLC